jgi:hypothetical protein
VHAETISSRSVGTAGLLGVGVLAAIVASCADASVAPMPETEASAAAVKGDAAPSSSASAAVPDVAPPASAAPSAIATAALSASAPSPSSSSAPATAKPTCPTSLARPVDYPVAVRLHAGVKRGWTRQRVIQHMGGPTRCEGATWVYVEGPFSGPEITTYVGFGGDVVTSVSSSTVGCRLY